MSSIREEEGTPFELVRWSIAEKFGWTLDYIDSLSIADLHEFMQIQDGRAHANKSIIRR